MSLRDPLHALPEEARETLDGRWEIRACLPGAMGTVLLLTDPATGGRFAAKTPRVEEGLSAETLRRFEAEARTWLSLGHHENVVEAFFYETIRWRGIERPFLFLEYVDGPTLDTLLRAEGRLAVPVALDVATGMAWGMSHAHGEGRAGSRIVHRDLKPDNAFVTRERVVKVSDFGIARALDRPEEHQNEGFGVGTPFYASPEQMRDARRADVRSDVYSFGAVVHQLLTGEPPFPAPDLSTLVWKVLRDPPPPLRAKVPETPEALERLVLDCLAKEPSQRPGSFTEVLERVSAIREIDELWLPPPGARSCDTCGWMSLSPRTSCALCGKRTGRGVRYAPTSRRWDLALPTMGRTGSGARLEVEGVQVRPRQPRAGEEVVVTVLVGNTGAAPAMGVALPYVRPSRDAFAFVDASPRRGFRGTIPPTAAGAPIRVSWTLRPLRDGRFRLRAPRVTWREADGRRGSVRGQDVEIVVVPNDVVPLVGRTAELARLGELLRHAESGGAAAGLVLGRPGTGKSRLAREALDRAAERGFSVLRGRCLDRGVEVRGALKESLRQLLDLPQTGGSGPGIAAALVQLLGDAARAEPRLLAFLVDELLGRPMAAGESARKHWSRFAAVVSRSRPLALVLEDVQRDPEVGWIALEMARAARSEKGRFLLVLTARGDADDETDDFVARVEEPGADAGAVIRLRALRRDEVERLVDAAFHPNDFATSAPWLAGELLSLSGGNPMFLTELLRALTSPGADGAALVSPREGEWTAGARLTPERLRELVPPRVEEMVVERLRDVEPAVRRFVEAAAVLGDVFETDLLREVLGGPETFEASLAALEEAGILRELAGGKIRFREPLFPEAIHRDLRTRDPMEHARLHAAAADLLSRRPGARSRNALRLARHAIQAGRPADGFAAMLDAARRHLDRQAYRRAAVVIEEARRVLDAGHRPRRSERVEYLDLRGRALYYIGDFEGALDAWRRVVTEAGEGRRADADLGAVYSFMGKVHEALGQLDDALYCFAVGLSIRRDEGQAFEAPRSLVNLAGLHVLRGETERARAYLDEAEAAATVAENHVALGRALTLRAKLLVQAGDTREARELLRRGLREAHTARDESGAADAWVVLGQACSREGRTDRALVHFRRALRIRQAAGDLAGIAASWNTLATVHEATGDLDAAQSEYERAADLARRIGSRRSHAVALTNLGRVQLDLGFPRKARATLEAARESAKSLGEPAFLAVTLADLAAALRWLGEDEAAGRLVDEAARIGAERGDPDVGAYALLRRAEHLRAVGRRDEARTVAEAAASLRGASAQVRADVLALRAELEVGDAADAAAREAVEIASELPAPDLRARAQAARGRADLRSGATASAATHLRRAAGMLLSSGHVTPFLAGVLADQARALEAEDPEAAAAARRRAEEVRRELTGRGYWLGDGARSDRRTAEEE